MYRLWLSRQRFQRTTSSHFPPIEDLVPPRWPPIALGSVESFRLFSYFFQSSLVQNRMLGYRDCKGVFAFRVLRAVLDAEDGHGTDEPKARSESEARCRFVHSLCVLTSSSCVALRVLSVYVI